MVPVGRLIVLRNTPKDQLTQAIAYISWPGLTALVLGPALGGLAAVAIVAGALLVVSTSRRREVRLLASVIVVFGLWAGLVAKGWLPAPVASPALWLVVPLVALAACAGYLVAGLAQDLPRYTRSPRRCGQCCANTGLSRRGVPSL